MRYLFVRPVVWLMPILLCLSTLTLLAAAPAQPARKPNIIFILVDDMGYADIGSYGVKDIRTPQLDKLARQGVRLTNAYANGPVCTPTRAAFISGRYQQRVGLEWAIPPGQKEAGLPVTPTSIARLLKENGYATGIFGKWHLGYKPEFSPNAHGFDEFFGILSGNVDMYSHKEINDEHDLYENLQEVERPGYLTDQFTTRAVSFIDRHASRPFFLYVPYNAVHWPFQLPGQPETVRTRKDWKEGTREIYAGMLERMDEGIGQLLAALDRHGIAKDTLVIFTNDNGGEWHLSQNGPFFHYKETIWEGGIRVPAIVRWPGRLPAGKVSDQAVITMDWTASIFAAAGAKLPAGQTLDGIDVLPILAGKQPEVERTFFWRIERGDRRQKAVRKGKWKLLQDGHLDLLFDLVKDPAERRNLSQQHRDVLNEMRGQLRNWEAELNRTPPPFKVK